MITNLGCSLLLFYLKGKVKPNEGKSSRCTLAGLPLSELDFPSLLLDLFSSIIAGMGDDLAACNFPNRDEGFPDPKGLIPVVEVVVAIFSPVIRDGEICVHPPAEVFEEGDRHWSNSLVAQFLGNPPNFSSMHKISSMLWEKDVEIKKVGNNLFLIRFESKDACDRVFDNGPWHFQNKLVILRKWKPNLKSLNFNLCKLPIWIHLLNIPLELFTGVGLSYIASALGYPLYMDSVIASKSCLAFVKVCVEVDADRILPRTVSVQLRDGSIASIGVFVPWMPCRCFHCKTFGHYDKTCPKQVNNDVDVGVRKKLDHAVGNLKKHGEAIWVPKKLMLSPSKGEGVVEKVSTVGAKSVVVEGIAKGKAVIVGSSNRFEVLVGMDSQDDSTSQVVGEVAMEVPLEGQGALGQILEQPSRQPREAAKAVAKNVQGLKAKKKAKGNRGRGVAFGGGGMASSSPS
ncbi:hypothetical protein V6N13_057933 [Hibiscus sabdariffa]